MPLDAADAQKSQQASKYPLAQGRSLEKDVALGYSDAYCHNHSATSVTAGSK